MSFFDNLSKFLLLNNDLITKYKLKTNCDFLSILKMNNKRSEINKLKITRFDYKNGLFLFDPLSLNYINLNENNSNIKCKILHGK